MTVTENINKFINYLNRVEYSDSDRPFHPLSVYGQVNDIKKFNEIINQLGNGDNVSANLLEMFLMFDNKQIELGCCRCLWLDDLSNILTGLKNSIL